MTTRRSATRALVAFVSVVGLATGAAGVWTPARAQVTTTATEAPPALECDSGKKGGDGLVIEFCRPKGAVSTARTFPLRINVENTRTAVGQQLEVTDISVEIVPTLPDQATPDPATKSEAKGAPRASLTWEPEFTTNGPYELRVVATGGPDVRQQRATALFNFGLAVAPQPPKSVKAAKVDDGSVLISWSKEGREPDVFYYEVSRAPEGSSTFGFVESVEAKATPRATDDPGVGSWRYRVVALRRGAKVDESIASSPATAAPVSITAPPTTTTTSDGAPSGDRPVGSAPGAATGGSTSGSTSTSQPGTTSGSRAAVGPRTITTTADGRRTISTIRRVERDPGFRETLPFDLPTDRPETPPLESVELGTDDDQAAGEDLVVDDAGERRRSLGFVAGGLLLFVLGMTGLFVKSEVRRVDELEALDPLLEPLPFPEVAPYAPTAATRVGPPAPDPEPPAVDEPSVEPTPTLVAAGAVPITADASRTRSRIPRRRAAGAGAPVPVAAVAPEAPVFEPLPVAAFVEADPAAVAPAEAAPAAVAPADATPADASPAGATPADAASAGDAAPPTARRRVRLGDVAPSGLAAVAVTRRRARAEVRAQRAEELATMFGGAATDTVDDERHLAELATELHAATPAARSSDRRVRRTVAPADAPDLDVPEPAAPAAPLDRRPSPTTRTRTSDRARRAPTRLPSRPADDRREGGAAVRPRRRGTGQGDRRLPVG